MSSKHRTTTARTATANDAPSTKSVIHDLADRVARLETALEEVARRRADVRREEHNEVLATLQQLAQHTHDLDVQFKRIAQIQADVDLLKRDLERLKASTG